jgi:mono/diheme cytochrome c family protein
VVAALVLSGCTTLDRAVGAVPWFTTMRDQVAVRPFEAIPGDSSRSPRFLPPEGSIPVNGREDSLDIYSPAGLKAVDAKRNPVARDAASLARGGKIYTTYCAVCHGVQGMGDGTVSGRLGYVPNLTLDMTRQRSDGYLYAMLRHGRGLMPRYGDKIRDPRDRWNVVNYVRSLQGAPSQ